MSKRNATFYLFLVVLLVLAALPALAGAASTDRYGSAELSDNYLQNELAAAGKANVFVKLAADANLDDAENVAGRVARAQFVHDTLTAHADSTQAEIRGFLDARGVSYQSFWINNSIYIPNAEAALVDALTERADVAYVRAEQQLPLVEPVEIQDGEAMEAVEWGVAKINAPDVWATGNTGQGIVVANVDTGVRYTHEALVNQYRGNLGGSFDHDYSWWDPDQVFATPSDSNGHGTHTIGTMVGGDGSGPFSNDIGVAPGAKWIAAQGCDSNSCSDFDLISSAQWIACPTRVDGTDPDCSKVPHIVNNSWGGGGGDGWYVSYVNAWLAAGIVPVFSAGNSGPFCGSVGSPGDYPHVIAVGATNSNDVLAYFSSKGPGTFRILKPDVVAPGANVRSAYRTNDSSYTTMSGTSMAAPHVAGTLALMLNESPSATLGQLYVAMIATATRGLGDPPGANECGGRPYNVYPNFHYGFGRINAAAAVSVLP